VSRKNAKIRRSKSRHREEQPQITIFNVKDAATTKSDFGATTAATMSSIPVITNSENRHQPVVARGSAAAKKGGAVPMSVLKPSNAAAGKKTPGLVLKKPSAAATTTTTTTTTTRPTSRNGKPSTAFTNNNNNIKSTAIAPSKKNIVATSAGAAKKKESPRTLYEEEDGADKKGTTENWESAQKEMDQMFKEQARDKLRGIPDIEVPGELQANNVDLFPYQRDGLRWMHAQETRSEEEAIPPFFVLKPNGKWRCALTHNRVQDAKPPAVRGGILAE
jgi:hypothetical protein